MGLKKQKTVFNSVGIGIICLWLILIGILFRRVNSGETKATAVPAGGKALAIEAPQREWMEIFLKDKKIGYAFNQVNPVGENYAVQEEILLNLNLMGQASGIRTVTQSVLDHDFRLKTFYFKMSSGAVSYQISGKMEGSWILLRMGEGRKKKIERIELPDAPTIGAGMAHFFKGRELKVGQTFRFPFFDPSTLSQRDMVVEVVAKDSLVIQRIRYKAFRLESDMWGQRLTFWLDEKGAVLKEKGFMGLTLVKSSAADAARGIEGSLSEDFYDVAAIPLEKPLKHANRLSYLKLKVKGLEKTPFDPAVLTKERQQYETGILEILREKIPSGNPYRLPYSDPPEHMKRLLQPEINIESDEEEIVKTARKVIGETKNPVFAANRLLNWVFNSIEKKPVVSVPSAVEVIKSRVGDCNEHAVLLTAMLRAVGIPARIAVGLVYARGKFFYHAWVEGYLGQWISMDATLNQMPADATHIKLVEGGLEKQVELIGLFGKIGLEIIDYRY